MFNVPDFMMENEMLNDNDDFLFNNSMCGDNDDSVNDHLSSHTNHTSIHGMFEDPTLMFPPGHP